MDSAKNLYERLIADPTALPVPPLAPPRPSAAVVPWRRNESGEVEVYWVERSPQLRFMGGWHAFPGGGLSRRDVPTPLEGHPRGLAETPPEAGMPASFARAEPEPVPPNEVPGIVACGLRELFEETGLLPAPELLAPRLPDALAEALEAGRRRMLERQLDLTGLLAETGLRPDACRLVYAGRWRTPPLAPIRFDNRFFLLEWPRQAAVQPRVIPGELAAGAWIRPGHALATWQRGEVITSPPIIHFLRVLAEDGPDDGLPRLQSPDETNIGPFRRVEFRPGVVLLPLATPTLPPATHTNAYLLGRQETVLVDPGSPFPEQIEGLAAALEESHDRLGTRLRAIWLTHHHGDHIGGVEALRRRFSVPVAAHRATAERLAAAGIPVDEELVDGQRVELAGDPPFPVRILHTPGHARGHLCFYDEDGGSLLAGDLIAGVGTIVVDPPEGDMTDYLASLERMAELAPRTLFPGHGPPQRDAVGYLRHYVEHRRWREGKVLEAWRSGIHDPAAMVPTVYDDVPAEAHPIAARQLEAHLLRLRQLGEIE